MRFRKTLDCEQTAGRSRIRQFVMAVLINLPVMSYGMTMAWMSPIGPLLSSQDSPFVPMSDEAISWMASVVCITAIPGVFIFGYILERHGRKIASISLSFPLMTCWVIKIFATESWTLILARAIAGLSAGGSYVVTPVYVKEISDDPIRGMLASLLILFQNAGYLWGYLLGALCGYYTIIIVSAAVPLIHILILIWMPESPSFLVHRGKKEEAIKVVAWLRKSTISDKDNILDINKLEEDFANNPKPSMVIILADIWRDRRKRLALWLGIWIISLEEASGCFTLSAYTGTVLAAADDGSELYSLLTPNLQAVFVGTMQIFGSFVATALVERCGRKPLLTVSCGVIATCMCTLGAWFQLQQLGINAGAATPVAVLSIAVFCNAAGMVPAPFVILSELFDYQTRGTVQVVIIALNWLIGFILIRAFSPAVQALGIHSVFWFFTLVNFGSLVYFLVRVPETKGKTIEQIYNDLELKSGKKTTKEITHL